MAGTVLALFRPVRSEARASLHDSIAAHADAEQALADAKAGVGRGMRQHDEAQERHAQATLALADAKAALASSMAASTSSQATLKARDSALRTARADEQSAADHVDGATVALGALQREAIAAAKSVEDAKAAIENAACAVVADEALSPSIQRCRALRRELDEVTIKLTAALNVELACLKFLSENREVVKHNRTISPEGHASFATVTLEWPRSDEFSEASTILGNEREIVDMNLQRPVREAWVECLAALLQDADAALPV